jgi:hypothetical protein
MGWSVWDQWLGTTWDRLGIGGTGTGGNGWVGTIPRDEWICIMTLEYTLVSSISFAIGSVISASACCAGHGYDN